MYFEDYVMSSMNMNGIAPLFNKSTFDQDIPHTHSQPIHDISNPVIICKTELPIEPKIELEEAADIDLGEKPGVKRPSQQDCVEAPDLKKSNLDPGFAGSLSSVPLNMIANDLDLKCSVFETGSMAPSNTSVSCPATVSEEVHVPDAMVGLIIGRGGEQISRLQTESRCKIQMATQELPTQEYRKCTLTGSLDAIAMAKSLIEQVISVENEKAAARVSGGVDGPTGIGFQSVPTGSFEMMIPGNLVARIIGKGGEVIKALQLETGAKIVIIQDSREYALEKPLRITGSADVIELARQRVEDVLAAEQLKLTGLKKGWNLGSQVTNNNTINGCYDVTPSFDITEVISIPSNKVGLVMGKGGETIRQICMTSGAHCQVDKNAPEGSREKNIVIKGKQENVLKAKLLVSEKVGDVYDRGYARDYIHMANNQIGSDIRISQLSQLSHGSAEPASGSGGQTDYSQQWAEYYRSLGMLKEAEIIEQQMIARGKVGVSGASRSSSPNDYSAQWAEYYRSMGNLKEAEAIEAQMKMKGVNHYYNFNGNEQPYGAR